MSDTAPQSEIPPPSSPEREVVVWLSHPEEPADGGNIYPAEALAEPANRGTQARWLLRRRVGVPVMLFLLTCVSTFLAGLSTWNPWDLITSPEADGLMGLRRAVLSNWADGVTYTLAVLGVLLAHEMGHFVATIIHRIPATFPFFLPFPVSPLGTLGAVIGMDGSRADRKEIFDIGLAGPLAGLVVAVPLFLIGVQQADLNQHQFGAYQLDLPLAAKLLMHWADTPGLTADQTLWQAQLNPLLMAGWVGFFVTGLNMLPVSQLDGGHVIYTLFGRRAHWIARAFMVSAVAYMLITWNLGLVVMIALILFIGTDHPPTRDDTVPIGWFRTALGLASLAIPILCFPPRVILQ